MRYALIVALVLLASPVLAQPPIATAGQSFAWSYTDASIASGAVIRFEVRVDGGDWTDVGMTRHPDPDTWHSPIPAITSGDHIWDVRACSNVICSTPSPTFPFVFGAVVDAVSGDGMRIVPTPEPQ